MIIFKNEINSFKWLNLLNNNKKYLSYFQKQSKGSHCIKKSNLKSFTLHFKKNLNGSQNFRGLLSFRNIIFEQLIFYALKRMVTETNFSQHFREYLQITLLDHVYDFCRFVALAVVHFKRQELTQKFNNIVYFFFINRGTDLKDFVHNEAVTFLFIIMTILQSIILKKENYFVQLMERILFPLKVSVGMLILNKRKDIQQTEFDQASDTIFLVGLGITLGILIIKNTKMSLRYKQCTEKGFNRLFIYDFHLMLLKISVGCLLSSFFSDNILLFMGMIALMNIGFNVTFIFIPIYENPRIQYLTMLTQFYIWIPLFCLVFSQILHLNQTAVQIFGFFGFFGYFCAGIFKSRILTRMIERKYYKNAKRFSLGRKGEKDEEDDGIIFMGILQQISNENSTYRLNWSQQFRSMVFNSINQRHRLLMSLAQNNNTLSKQNLQIGQTQNNQEGKGCQKDSSQNSPSRIKIVNETQSQRTFGIKLLEQYILEESATAFKQILSQIVFELLSNQWASQKQQSQSYSKLRMFCCYDMAMFKDVWKRFWIFYGLDNKAIQLSWFHKIQKDICYGTLMEQIGGHLTRKEKRHEQFVMQKQENHSRKEKTQDRQNNIQTITVLKNCQNSSGKKCYFDLNQSSSIRCMNRPIPFYNSQFNQFYHYNGLRSKIVVTFQQFISNQHILIKIYQNILQNKQELRPFYYKRRELRLQLEGLMKEYREVVMKSERSWTQGANFWIIVRFIYKRYVLKEQFIACKEWKKDMDKLQIIITKKRLQLKVSELLKNDNSSQDNLMYFVKKHNAYQPQEQNTGVMVVSGYRNLGRIEGCSQSLKTALKLGMKNNQNSLTYSENGPQLTQNILQININDLFPVKQWGSKHRKLMFSYYQKSNEQLNHSEQKCYLKNQNAIVEMKFRLYYSVLLEDDIQVIMDCLFKEVNSMEIMDEKDNCVFEKANNEIPHKVEFQLNGRKSSIDAKDDGKLKSLQMKLLNNKKLSHKQNCKYIQDDDQTQKLNITTTIFDRTYHITQLRYYRMEVHQRQSKQALQNALQDIPIQKDSQYLENQENFSIYKKQFNHYDCQWTFLKRVVKTSVMFYFLTFSYYLFEENRNNQDILMLIKDKIRLQNDFIMQDEFTSMHVGMMFVMEKIFGGLEQNGSINQQQTRKIMHDLFNFTKTSINKISEKYPALSEQIDTSFLFSYMTQLKHIYIQNHSLLTHLLTKEILFFSLVSTFTNLTQLMSSNSSSFKNYTIDDLKLTENKKKLIGEFFFQTIRMSEYVYETNGVVEDILALQRELFQRNKILRNGFCWFFESIFAIFSTIILYLVIRIKKSVLNHYNDSIHLSQVFIHNYRKDFIAFELIIQQFYSSEKPHNSKSSQKKSYQKKTSPHSSLESLTKSNQLNLTTKLRSQRHQSLKLSLLSFFAQSIVFPFVRWFVVMGAIFAVYVMASHRAAILQDYSKGVTDLARLNAYMIQGLGFTLYEQKAKQVMVPQSMVNKFQEVMETIRGIDKVIIMKQLYPFHQKFGIDVLYNKNTLYQNFDILQPGKIFFNSQNTYSLQQNANSLTLNENILFRHFINSELDNIKQRLVQTYYKINEIVEILIQVTKKSFLMIQDDVQDNYLNIFVVVLAFLIFQFIMGCKHFDLMYFQFYQQYLNIGTCRQLKKQHGYEYFVNLAQSLAKHNPRPLQL